MDKDKTKILRESKFHSCSPHAHENKVSQIIDRCKIDVCENLIPIEQVLDKNFENCDGPVPLFDSHRSSLYRARKRYLECDQLQFNNVEDVYVPEVSGHNFLLCEDGETEKILIFVTKLVRKIIRGKTLYMGDGTFLSVLVPFFQLYTLHVDVNSNGKITNVNPVIYALLPNKTEQTYTYPFIISIERET